MRIAAVSAAWTKGREAFAPTVPEEPGDADGDGSVASDEATAPQACETDGIEGHVGMTLPVVADVVATATACAALAVTMLSAGGFFGQVPCLAGIVLSVVAVAAAFLLTQSDASRIRAVPAAMLGVAVAYATSMVVAGPTLTTSIEAGKWCSYAAFACVVASVSQRRRNDILRVVAWLGIVTAIAGILVAAGLVPMRAGMVGTRLQFTFQYANAAAVWFGATGLLTLMSPDSRQRLLSPVPLAAALLTQSVGGLACMAVVVAVATALAHKRGDSDPAYRMLWGALVAGVLAAACLVQPMVGLVVLISFAVAVTCVPERYEAVLGGVRSHVPMTVLAGVLALGIVGAGVARVPRLQAAAASLAERTSHVVDGIGIWLSSPVLGIGPDNWQYAYPYHQSATYQVSVVHSSPVQILTDAGIVGLVPLAVACAAGLAGLLRKARKGGADHASGSPSALTFPWAAGELCAAALLVTHSLVDFDLRFGALAMLLVLLLADGAAASPDDAPAGGKRRIVGSSVVTACSVACLVACSVGFSSSVALDEIRVASKTGDARACLAEAERHPIAARDQEVRSLCLEALVANGRYADAIAEFEGMETPSGSDVLAAAFAMRQAGDDAGADEAIRRYAELMPYDEDLQEMVAGLETDRYDETGDDEGKGI